MKPKVLLASLSLLPFFTLWAAPESITNEPSGVTIQTQDTTLGSAETNMPSEGMQSTRRMPTADELEKVRKDRNWMVEGMKEKQAADAKAQSSTTLKNSENTDMSQSIIDMVLNKNQKNDPRNTSRTNIQTRDNTTSTTEKKSDSKPSDNTITTFKPSIATNSFDTQKPANSSGENSITSSFLQQERANAKRAGFKEPKRGTSMQDPLINPFANLPIPEDALPQAQPSSSQVSQLNTTPAITNTPTPPNNNPWVQNNNSTNANNMAMSGNMASAAGPGNPGNQGMPSSMAVNSPTPGPRVAVEQPYAILREQELIRQLQQNTSNRPKVQDLRSTVRDPNEARLF